MSDIYKSILIMGDMMKVLFFLVLFGFWGCVEIQPETQNESVELTLDGDRADRNGEVRLRADGLSVWMRPTIEVPTFTRSTWVLSGRVSRNINAISGSVLGQPTDLQQVSKRKFEVSISTEGFEDALIHGLWVHVETSAGTHTLKLSLEGRLVSGQGSSYIYPYKRIQLVADGGKPVFRATVSTRKDFQTLVGSNDDDSEPESVKVSDRKFHLDFQSGLLTWAATPYEDPLVLIGESSGKRYRRNAYIGVALIGMGLTSDDPLNVWPAPLCDESGDVLEQIACGPNSSEALIRVFANDFRSFIISHYRANSVAIEQAGGVHRTEALLNVDTADIVEIVDPNLGYDLSTVLLFAHPDVLFPDSGKLWVGAYERSTDDLIEITQQD